MSEEAFDRMKCECGTEFFGHCEMIPLEPPPPPPTLPWKLEADRPCPGCAEYDQVVKRTTEDYIAL